MRHKESYDDFAQMGLHFIGSGFPSHCTGEGAEEGDGVALADDAGQIVPACEADAIAI